MDIISPQHTSRAPEVITSSAEAMEVQKGQMLRELWDIKFGLLGARFKIELFWCGNINCDQTMLCVCVSFKDFFYKYLWLPACMYVHPTLRGCKRAREPLELKLWMLGSELHWPPLSYRSRNLSSPTIGVLLCLLMGGSRGDSINKESGAPRTFGKFHATCLVGSSALEHLVQNHCLQCPHGNSHRGCHSLWSPQAAR